MEKVPKKKKTPEQEQKQVTVSEPLDTHINVDPKLIKEWEQFNSIISNPKNTQGFTTPYVSTTHKKLVNIVPIARTSGPPQFHKEIEILPENPTDEIVLHVEEIPPLDIFDSPKHRVVVKRQEKDEN